MPFYSLFRSHLHHLPFGLRLSTPCCLIGSQTRLSRNLRVLPGTPGATTLDPVFPTRFGIVHSFPPGIDLGLRPKALNWHDTNGTTNLTAESPDTHRLEEVRKVWKSQLPENVCSEVWFMGDKDDSEKYLSALENGDRGILTMRKMQIRELLCLVCDELSPLPYRRLQV